MRNIPYISIPLMEENGILKKKKLERQGKNIDEFALELNTQEHCDFYRHEGDIGEVVTNPRKFYKKGEPLS